jgi:hypothetical protein
MPIEFIGDSFSSTERVITQCHSLDHALKDAQGNLGYPLRSVTELYGAKGTGKCLGRGTKVVMFDGSIKKVEDVEVGDLLMGPDSTSRKVLSLAKGREQMYWIRQTYAMDYRVNESHILSLKFATKSKNRFGSKYGDIVNISVKDLLSKSKSFTKMYWKGYKVGISFQDSGEILPVHPYFLGLWLGDGCSDNVGITTGDYEVVDFLYSYAKFLGLQLSEKGIEEGCSTYSITSGNRGGINTNSLQGKLRSLEVLNNKHIPEMYLHANRECRLQLLAGLIDSDGSKTYHVGYEITQKNFILLQQIKYLCDSLGLRTSKTIHTRMSQAQTGEPREVYRISFGGNLLFNCPIRIERKLPDKNAKLDIGYDLTSIKIEKDIVDDYFGFGLDGDGLFLLEDMTVTHNTTFAVSMMGMVAAKTHKNITMLDWEGQSKETIDGILTAQNFYGRVNYMLNLGGESPEDTLERFIESITDSDWNVGLMDSLGAFTPSALLEGKIGDANMGVMAREIGQFTSKVVHFTRQASEPGAVFLTNHLHPKIGAMMSGQDTSGGEKKKFLAHIRIDLKRVYIGNSAVDFGDSYLLKGHVDHNRFGFPKHDFYVFVLGGEGIHIGLTALWDCVMIGLVKLSAKSIKDSVSVEMDGRSFGKMRTILKEKDNPEFFVPFINALRENTGDDFVDEEEVEEDEPKKKGKKK